jgi:hypothetical protein
MCSARRIAGIVLAVSLPLGAGQQSATFGVRTVVLPSARVVSQVHVSARALQMQLTGNVPAPAIQIGDGPLRIADGQVLRLPGSGDVRVTIQY